MSSTCCDRSHNVGNNINSIVVRLLPKCSVRSVFKMTLATTSGTGRSDLVAAAYPTLNPQLYQREPLKRTLQPYVTGSSVVAIKYKDGVMMATDTMGSYGSSARYQNVKRTEAIGKYSLIAASGEFSDFQWITNLARELHLEDWCSQDGHEMKPAELSSYLGRVMYNRRSRFNPLWNSVIVAGFANGKSHLSYVDMHGTTFQEDCLATAFGSYFATPLLRARCKPDMTEQEARKLIHDCFVILYNRDCQAHYMVQFSKATANGVEIEEPVKIQTPPTNYSILSTPTSKMDMLSNAW
eukprot:Selendium_serpulae@DN6028_c0_g1_i6.p1